MLNIGISAILFYKIYKKGRYLFNMIVNINEQNREQYEDLFERVSRVLTGLNKSGSGEYIDNDNEKGDGAKYTLSEETELSQYLANIPEDDQKYLIDGDGNIQINSLIEYFSFLKFLGELHPRFIRLPLDESLFEINLNQRLITIPSGNNVYAVTNDDHAETVYFKCARYFDTVDLGSDDMNIIIQSRFTNDEGEEIYKIFKAQKVDVDSIPNHIVFGWIIPKEITQKDGSVTISVRFYQLNETNTAFIYSLGTQPTSIQVLRSFNFSIDDLSNSDMVVATEPFLTNFAIKGTDSITSPVLEYAENSAGNWDNNLSEPVTFIVSPTITSSGESVEYKWQYKDPYNTSDVSEVKQYNYTEKKDVTAEYFSANKQSLYDKDGNSVASENFDENAIYYTREVASNSLRLDAKKGGTYNCKVTVKKNRYSKSGTTEDRTIIWPARIQFKTIKEGETNPFNTPLIAESITSGGYKLFDKALDDFKNYIERISDEETGYFDSEKINIALSNEITFAENSDIITMPLTATNGPLNDLTKSSTSANSITILKPFTIQNIESENNHLKITFSGGKFYNNNTYELTSDYSKALTVEIQVIPPSNELQSFTFNSFEDLNNSKNLISGVTYTYYLIITDKNNNKLYSNVPQTEG